MVSIQVVARVTRQHMITLDDARHASYLMEAMRSDPMLSNMENVALAIYLLCEKRRGEHSPHANYIASLPDRYTTPLYYSEEQMALLRPSPAFEHALKMYRAIVRQFAYFHVLLATAHVKSADKVSFLLQRKH